MSKYSIIRTLFLKHKYQIFLTYFLFTLEVVGELLRPFFLGNAVDGLIKGNYNGLVIMCSVHLVWLVIGTIRHRYDTRTYTAIYTTLVTKFLSRKIPLDQISKLSAHSTLAKEFVDFLEYDLAYVISALVNLLGSVFLLYFYNTYVLLLCLAILIPVSIVSFKYGSKMKKLNRLSNDEFEKQVDVITSGNKTKINTHYNNLRKWQIKISDQEAWNFGILELFCLVLIGGSLLVIKNFGGSAITAGSIIGVYNYILKFSSGLDTLPYMLQRVTNLSDITSRVALHEEDMNDDKD